MTIAYPMTDGRWWVWNSKGHWEARDVMTDWELEKQIAELLKATKELGELVERKDARIAALEALVVALRRANRREDLG